MPSILHSPPPARVLPKPEVLRQNVISKLDALTVEQLAEVHDMLQEMELHRIAEELGLSLAEDERAGKLSAEAIEQSKQEFRKEHPYGQLNPSR